MERCEIGSDAPTRATPTREYFEHDPFAALILEAKGALTVDER
jgi:hypothetical protein